jgi:hypothetical protein
MEKVKRKVAAFRLPPKMIGQLERSAHKRGITKTGVVEQALAMFFRWEAKKQKVKRGA